jgi:hypothetical protein
VLRRRVGLTDRVARKRNDIANAKLPWQLKWTTGSALSHALLTTILSKLMAGSWHASFVHSSILLARLVVSFQEHPTASVLAFHNQHRMYALVHLNILLLFLELRKKNWRVLAMFVELRRKIQRPTMYFWPFEQEDLSFVS